MAVDVDAPERELSARGELTEDDSSHGDDAFTEQRDTQKRASPNSTSPRQGDVRGCPINRVTTGGRLARPSSNPAALTPSM